MTHLILAPIAAALLLAGCAQTYVSPVSVTRFVGDAPARLGMGTIAVGSAPGLDANSLEFSVWQDAVAAELAQLGYQVVAGAGAAQVAELRISRAPAQAQRSRGPVNVGVGGSTGSYGSGVGVGIGLDLSGPPPAVAESQLGVIIRDNATGQALWEGRAQFSASSNSKYADRTAAAQAMAHALFEGFPGVSGETVDRRVP